MRKIAILVPDLVLGGGQRVAVNTAHLLAKKHSVEIVIFSKENQLFTSDIRIINLNIPKSKSFLGKLFNVFRRAYSYKKLLIKQQYDFTISFLESANLCAFLTTRKKSILTFHCHPNLLTTSDQLILRHLFKFSNQLVAVSQGLKLTLEKSYIKKHVSVINNAVDPISIKQQSREESFTHPRDFIVAVGRLSQEKQFSKLIDIYCQCKASKELDLIIIGDGAQFDLLKYKAQNHKNIFLLGEKSNPFPIIKKAQMFVMTSKYEAFPMVLLESLSLGTPVIAFDCPTGLKDIISNNENGILVENGNVSDFSKAIDRVFFEKDLKQKLISNTYRSVNNFTSETIRNKWEKYFKSIQL